MYSQSTSNNKRQQGNFDASNMILSEAIEQLSALTGLDTQASLNLLNQSISAQSTMRQRVRQQNVIEQQESDFIVSLFNS